MSKYKNLTTESFRKLFIEQENGCWLPIAKPGILGYWQIPYSGRRLMAHRVSYMLHVGSIPDGMQVCHSCDDPRCSNPAHLWIGSNRRNHLDCIEKGRHANTEKSHCKRGHEFTHENTRIDSGRKRTCLTCERLRAKADHKKKIPGYCINGHQLVGGNVYVTPGDGRKQCRICRREAVYRRARKLRPLVQGVSAP